MLNNQFPDFMWVFPFMFRVRSRNAGCRPRQLRSTQFPPSSCRLFPCLTASSTIQLGHIVGHHLSSQKSQPSDCAEQRRRSARNSQRQSDGVIAHIWPYDDLFRILSPPFWHSEINFSAQHRRPIVVDKMRVESVKTWQMQGQFWRRRFWGFLSQIYGYS